MEDKPKRNIHLFNTEIDYWLSHDEIEKVTVLNENHDHCQICFANGKKEELPFRIGKVKQIIEESGNKEYFDSGRSKISHK
ncbi:MAG: hypothetical protein HUK01_01700 [Bacteroidaceae bacterium]|nr:hypothetical protein [Bacteroidaceae bacterium]